MALLMWKTPQKVELQIVKMMMTLISLDLMMRRYGINWLMCVSQLKHRLCSQNPWVLTLASLKITCLLKFWLATWWIKSNHHLSAELVMDFLFSDKASLCYNPPALNWGTTHFVKYMKFFPLQESEEAKRLREERLAQYESKKAKSRSFYNSCLIDLIDFRMWIIFLKK